MTSPDLYLSHALDDVRLGAALVDFLEEVVPTADGHIACTAVPGYQAPGANTRDNAITVGLWSEAGRQQIVADLMRSVERGRSAVLLCEEPADVQLPDVLSAVTRLSTDRSGLSLLLEDVAYALGVLPRMNAACSESLSELLLAVHRERDLRRRADETPPHAELPIDDEMELEMEPPPASDVRELAPQATDLDSAPAWVGGSANASGCAGVGALLAECLFNDTPLQLDDARPGGRVHGLYEALGGTQPSYPQAADVEAWQGLFDTVLETLPIERQPLLSWFEAGFQLSLTCNLACSVGDAADAAAIAEARMEAWSEFALSAQHLGLPTEVMEAVSTGIAQLLALGEAASMLPGEQGREDCAEYLCDAARMYDQQRTLSRRDRQAMLA